ncbi:hypothetical protein [Mucilaginibacter sp.]
MHSTINKTHEVLSNEAIKQWFNGFIAHISVDKMMMETNTAPSDLKDFYTSAMLEDYAAISKTIRDTSSKYFIGNLVQFYINAFVTYKIAPQKLAFDFSDAKILVWAEILDNDEKAEEALILSEAKANAKFADTGFYISSTIVEQSDDLPIPSHYNEVKFHGGLSGSH